MQKRNALMAAAFGIGVLTVVGVQAQQKHQERDADRDGLHPDSAARQPLRLCGRHRRRERSDVRGALRARREIPAAWRRDAHRPRGASANVGYRNSRGPQSVFHFLMSHVIEPTRRRRPRQGAARAVRHRRQRRAEPRLRRRALRRRLRADEGRLALQAATVHPVAVRLRAGGADDRRARVPQGLEGAGRRARR